MVRTGSLRVTSISQPQSADGALPGEYSVAIVALDTHDRGERRPSTSRRPCNLLPDNYADPRSSGLLATVLQQQGQRFDLDLRE